MIRSFLESSGGLVADGAMSFHSPEGAALSRIQLAMASASGSYSSDGTALPFTNLVEFIVPDNGNDEVVAIAKKLADFLNWELVEEDH